MINVAGHQIGTMEVASALVSHPKVAEAAVVGRLHQLKGQSLVVYVVLKTGEHRSEGVKEELRQHVGKEIGAIGMIDDVFITNKLPKTRSGKIMHRVIRALVSAQEIEGTTTLEDPGAVERSAWLGAVQRKAA